MKQISKIIVMLLCITIVSLGLLPIVSAVWNGTGGTFSQDGLYSIHTFTSNGTFTWTGETQNISFLMIGGGGAGGQDTVGGAGGGGAGGVVYNGSANITAGVYSVNIGLGGNSSGANSSFNYTTLQAAGGGIGQYYPGTGGSVGGSGGGAGQNGGTGLNGIPGQGNKGGNGGTGTGGGGGAGAVGGNMSGANGGAGGAGIVNGINGTAVTWACGGGGAGNSGGTNGGAGCATARAGKAGTAATANFGGGGGGGGEGTSNGNGGSGIFIVRYLTAPGTLPSISLVSPTNGQVFTSNNVNLSTLPFDIDNSTGLNVQIYLNISGGWVSNQTNSSAFNNTATDFNNIALPFGTYLWNALVSDGLNSSFAPSNRTFVLSPYGINSQTYNNVTFETAIETYSINISLAPGVNLNTAYLSYNGTLYAGSVNSIGNDRILNRTLNIPNVSAQTNVTFFWVLNLSVGNFNTTSTTQTINTLALDNCGINTNIILNYTIYDEDTRVFLNNNTFNTSANVLVRLSGDFSGNNYEYYAANVRTNSFQICVSNALITGQNYRLDAEVQYSAVDRVTEYNYIQNYTLNTSVSPRNISLYDLLINNSQEFLITFKDSNLIPVEGALIELARQYLDLGQFLSVEIAKTDNDGKTIGHFVLNDEVYTIYVKKNGVLLATYENVRAFCSDIVTGDCRINLNQVSSTSNPSSFLNYLGVIGTEAYNDTSKVYTFDFTINDSSTKTINVTILKYDNFLNTSICSQVLTSSSGTITCTIPSAYYNSTGLVTILVDGVEYSSHTFEISISKSDVLNASRFILAFFLIITIPLLAFTSGPMTLLMFIVGLVLAGSLAVIDWGGFIGPFSAFLWFVVAAIILLIKASSRRQQ